MFCRLRERFFHLTHAYLSQGLGFMHVDETENGLMLTKLDFSATRKMSGDLPATGYWICHGCVLGSEQWERSPVSHEWLHKGSLFTGHAKSYWVNFFLLMNLDIAPYILTITLQMYRKPLESNFLTSLLCEEKSKHAKWWEERQQNPLMSFLVMFTCNPKNYAK